MRDRTYREPAMTRQDMCRWQRVRAPLRLTDMKKAEARLFIGFLGLFRIFPNLDCMESRGIEPLTSSLRTKRSTN